MTDMSEWFKERREIHASAVEEAARAIWDNDDPEGESPNENFEDEPKWSQERYRQSAEAAVEASCVSATLLALLTAVEKVLELHVPETEYPDPITGECSCVECNRADREGICPTLYPCPTVLAVQSAIEGVRQ